MPKPLAKWSSARDAWETSQVSICGHSAVFSETWPTSGMTLSGTAYALPTSARLTDASASLSLLPTPNTVDQSGSTPGTLRVEQGHQVDLRSAVIDLLQTPQARDWKGAPGSTHRNGGLTRQVDELLPTMTTSDRNGAGVGPNRTGAPNLSTVVDEKLLPTTTRAVQGETRNHTIYERAGDKVNNLENALAPLLPTPMAMIEDSKSPEHRQSYGHGSYFSDLPHLLGLVDGSPEHSAQPSEPSATELMPTPQAADGMGGHSNRSGARSNEKLLPGVATELASTGSSRRAKRASTSESMPDLFSDGSYC